MIDRLIHLVVRKNELNRKRRRFYYLANPTSIYNMSEEDLNKWRNSPDYAFYITEYEKAKTDMKAMTKFMREMRKEYGATYVWDNSGAIRAVEYQGDRIEEKQFKQYSESFLAERILLGAE